MINKKHLEIRDKLFKGDLGAEAKLQNDSILAILIRQDAIVGAMTATAKAKYDEAIAPYKEFTDKVKAEAIESYKAKASIVGKPTIFDSE